MYTSFTVKNYRCFKNLTVDPLARINLITGKNNVGKTSLLEAFWLHSGYHNPRLAVSVNSLRGITYQDSEFLRNLFINSNTNESIQFTSRDEQDIVSTLSVQIEAQTSITVSLVVGETASLTTKPDTAEVYAPQIIFTYDKGNYNVTTCGTLQGNRLNIDKSLAARPLNAILLSAGHVPNGAELAERFSELSLHKREDTVIDTLKLIEPRLQDLKLHFKANVPTIYGDIGTEKRIPIQLMGNGIGRLLNILLAIPTVKDSILLIDGLDSGFHYSIMKKVWQTIAELAHDFNVQLFATTHSADCIDAAHATFVNAPNYDFRLHRLERVNDEIKSITYDQNMLATAIEMELETR